MDEEEPMDISGESFSSESPARSHWSSTSRTSAHRQSFPLKQHTKSLDRQFSAKVPKRLSMSSLSSPSRGNNSRESYGRSPRHSMPAYTSPSRLPPTLSEQIRGQSTPIRHLTDNYEKPESGHRHRHQVRHRHSSNEENEVVEEKNTHTFNYERKKRVEPYVTLNQKFAFLIFLILLFIIVHLIQSAKPTQCKMTLDIPKLKDNLKKNVFGQHIASDLILSMSRNLSKHFYGSMKSTQTVLSFHGWAGIGKNHIANILVKTFSPVKPNTFLVPLHFPHISQDEEYRTLIPQWIKGNISTCTMCVFVFDEMDKASEGVVEGLRSALAVIKHSNIKTRIWTLFVLLSNSHGSDINNYLFSQLSKGRERESLTREEFLPILTNQSERSWYTALVSEGLITHMVPFLPLTKQHVHNCINRDLYLKKRVPNRATILKIMDELPFYQPFEESEHYSTTGCKRVSSKVDLRIDD